MKVYFLSNQQSNNEEPQQPPAPPRMMLSTISPKKQIPSSLFVLVVLFVCYAGSAHAILIVDTGPGPVSSGGAWIGTDPEVSGELVYRAGQFTTVNAYSVNSIEGWFSTSSPDSLGGIGEMVIYGDNSGSVDTGIELFRSSFNVPNGVVDWQGVTGGSLFTLNPGTYWVAAESNLNEMGAVMTTDAPNPLDKYAADTGAGYVAEGSRMGFRIDGDLTVPEPATMLLFGSGLVGAFIRRRRKS